MLSRLANQGLIDMREHSPPLLELALGRMSNRLMRCYGGLSKERALGACPRTLQSWIESRWVRGCNSIAVRLHVRVRV